MAKSNQEFTQMYVPEFKLTQVADINLEKLTTLTGSTTGVQVLSQFIAQKGLTEQINVNEFVFIVYLNKRNKVIAITNLAIGGIDMTVMDVRLVFGLGLKCGASAMIVAHNHPTGNLQPSEADRQIARRIKEVGVLLQINALDFLIITSNNGYYSFADNSEYAHGGMMADGGKVRWQDVYVGDNALVIAENKMGIVVKPYGRRFHLKFPDGSEKTYSAEELEFFKDEEFAKGGITEHGLRVGDTIVSEIDENTIVVENPASGRRTINISTGNPMAKGGMSDKIVLLVKDKKGNVVLRTTSTNKASDYCGLHGRENFTVETLDGRRIMAKGGRVPTIKESDIEVGRKFELANGEIIEIKKLFTDASYREENRVEYSRDGKLAENGVNALKIFINNFRKDIAVPSLFAEGGRMGFKALSEKVAKHYAGKSVPAKYQPEYGKFYDGDEAKTVGNKVAAKVYRLQQGK